MPLNRVSWISANAAVLLGSCSFALWFLPLGWTQPTPVQHLLMHPVQAVLLALCGVALICLQEEKHRRHTRIGLILAAVVSAVSAWELVGASVEPMAPWALGRFLSAVHGGLGNPTPLDVTLPFGLTGLALLALNFKRRSWFAISSWLGWVSISFALLSLLSLALTVSSNWRVSIIGSLGFLLLGVGLICARIETKLTTIIEGSHPLGSLSARLALLGLLVPLLLYSIEIWLFRPISPQLQDMFVLVALLYSITVLGVLTLALRRMDQLDFQRREAEGSRDALLARLQQQASSLEIQVAERTRRLKETSERLQLALRSSNFGVWDLDIATQHLTWDARLHEIYGIAPEDFDGQRQTWLKLVHPEDRVRVSSFESQALDNANVYTGTFRLLRPDGSLRHIESHGYIQRDSRGQAVRIIGINRDVTSEREHAQAVAALNQRLQFVLNSTGYGVWEYDLAAGRFIWDDHLLQIHGRTRTQVTGQFKEWQDLVHPDDRHRVLQELAELREGRLTQLKHEYRIVRPDGSVRTIEAHGYLLRDTEGRAQRLIGLDSDISASRELREELRITEERWRLALSSNNDGVWDWNIATGEVYRDQRYAEIVGQTPEEIAPDRHVWQCYGHPEDIPATNNALAEHLDDRRPVYQSEYRLRHKAGHWVWVLDRGKVVARDPKGQPLRMVGTQTDITPRKQLEERLRHGEEMSLQLGRLAQIGAWEWDLKTGLLTWSPEMFRIHEVELGYEPAAPQFLDFYPPEARRTLSEVLQQTVQTGAGFDLELPFTTARGHKLWIRMLGRGDTLDGHTTRVYGAFQDITARRDAEDMRRQLEGQLFQAQKMETLGTLAGGIAHDFNNLLTGILGYQDLAIDTLPEDDQARNYLTAAREASMRARELVDQILTFGRQAGSEKVPVNLSQVVEDARRFLRATVPATIRIEVELEPDCGRVLADATQIHQVLLNLGSNAAHAMRNTGGSMRITLQSVTLEHEEAASLNHIEAGRYLCLIFSDTGHGMDEETRKRIFDPFFTTKEVGQGTGLGLSVVHGIIQAHRGAITVRSSPGHGATFTIYLPVAQVEASEDPASILATPCGTGQLIAVVDDEDIVRSFAQMALEKNGYRVGSYDSPAHCLEALRQRPGDFALLLTDQTMPVMKGLELATEARRIAPHLPVIIMSGYFSRISPEKLAELGQVALLSKPFTNEELARAVHKGLNPDDTLVAPLET